MSGTEIYLNGSLLTKIPSADSVSIGNLKRLANEVAILNGLVGWSTEIRRADGSNLLPAVYLTDTYDNSWMKGGAILIINSN